MYTHLSHQVEFVMWCITGCGTNKSRSKNRKHLYYGRGVVRAILNSTIENILFKMYLTIKHVLVEFGTNTICKPKNKI
jgi:hypothetical protein